ncbi:2Fe-2S iron-sulfur cluster-binding protein [Acidiphilium sp.]|uniref:2Fe-2S iron-sulfur cluster-binding protein n=1 Tax=Acidiphilium sp. TaxID=527 RepID=UPI003D08491D
MFGLRVASVRQETPDAVSIAFAVPAALRAAYAFAPGQYLTIEAILDGEAQRRAYSICSTPESGEMRIAVRRIAGGAMSVYLTTAIAAGDQLSVMTPTGRFGALPPPDGPRRIAAFAAGSGITPVIGVIGTLLAREAQTRVWLAYGNRSAETILFREALAALKDRYPDRFALIHVLSREAQDIPLLNGRIDQAKATILLRMMAGPVDHVLICGPAAMIGDVEAAARAQGVAAGAIHAERFVSAHGGAPRRVAPVADAAGMAVTIIADGKRRVITAAAGEAVLDAALRAGLDLPYACKGGMCSTCRARLVAGTAPMAVNFALEPWEIDAGFVLTCQARPAGEGVIVDYDAV